ncbi:MAG TPA: FtsK/SpoIIIE domain-containing protein, partial [Tepidisphaeraceae bacterium]|nr:FtsK/SpoIIIE domain-containing protein [Tepidisphaeraceae bacterium]
YWKGKPGYDPNADVNGDDAVTSVDVKLARSLAGRKVAGTRQWLMFYQERLGQIEAQHRADTDTLNESIKATRQRIQLDSKTNERQIKKEFDQAVWLTESLYDGTETQLREEGKHAKEQLATRLKELDDKEHKAAALLLRYGLASPHPTPPPGEDHPIPENPQAIFDACSAAIAQHLAQLKDLRLPQLFVGARPHFLGALLCAFVMLVTQAIVGRWEPHIVTVLLAGAVTLVLFLIAAAILCAKARAEVKRAYAPLRQALDDTRHAAQATYDAGIKARELQLAQTLEKRQNEERVAKDKYQPLLIQAAGRRDATLQVAQMDYAQKKTALDAQYDQAIRETNAWRDHALLEAQQRHESELQAAHQRHQQQIATNEQRHQEDRIALERRLTDGLPQIQAPTDQAMLNFVSDWNDPRWQNWTPPTQFPSLVPFGQMTVDLRKVADSIPRTGQLTIKLPEAFSAPATFAFPRHASLLIQTDRDGRPHAFRALQMVMARLLTSLPPGRVRFTLIDPVGLGQNFAGFMHLADHDEALVGARIWTESEHIEQRLADLTEHMETVIQKYLRNEFDTIDDYNAQAGELAEPYRFLVIADFPQAFTDDALRRLSSIATTGARCGVYTLILRDTRQPLPPGIHLDELESHSVTLVWDGQTFTWKDEVFQQFPLVLDPPPSEEALTHILDRVGQYAKEAKRVEVAFNTIAPTPEQRWSLSATDELRVAIGRLGATRLQTLRLGRGVAQHALLAGKTGSGKSTLLHVLITNLALWYSPDEVEFYLIDFKKGVEFKAYTTYVLPHARAIAVESDREFGLSVLQRVDAELTRRGDLFRKAGVQDLASFRALAATQTSSADPSAFPKLPRTLLIIDEFQEFFSEDDKLSQDSALLLDRLVRQGRAFGIHVLLGSQTIGGTAGLSRSTLGQMAVRIALQCSEADSQLILGDSNSAARLLSRPGEAIYNDAGGLVEANSPFQISWLPDEQREEYLKGILDLAKTLPHHPAAPIVFEGNTAADITKNARLVRLLESPVWPVASNVPLAWLGEPVAIKDPTAAAFRHQSGANLLIIGQHEESATAIMAASLISLAISHAPQSALFYVLDGIAADSPLANVFKQTAAALPHTVRFVEYRAVPDAFAELAEQ